MIARRYTSEDFRDWDTFVAQSREGTFLFQRAFMDYHRHRFTDFSLVFLKENKWIGCLPACWYREERKVIAHGGLTYGSLLTLSTATTLQIKEMLQLAAQTYHKEGIETVVFKPIPYIYQRGTADEVLYWLFRADATLRARGLATTIDFSLPLHFSSQRKRGRNKALRSGCCMLSSPLPSSLPAFWEVLTAALQRHHTVPVHCLAEMQLLMERFPKEIALRVVTIEEKVIAGVVLFLTPHVVHCQYIAANEKGKSCGALDLLFIDLIQELHTQYQQQPFTAPRYFDFGISTEKEGAWLNEGLIWQKEGFGGHGVCYDAYQVSVQQLLLL